MTILEKLLQKRKDTLPEDRYNELVDALSIPTKESAFADFTLRYYFNHIESINPPEIRKKIVSWNIYNVGSIDEDADPIPEQTDGIIRIIHMSDTHDLHHKYQEIPKGDIFIHSGDWSCDGGLDEVERFIEFLERVPCKEKIVIAGNHDTIMDGVFYEERWNFYHNEKLNYRQLQNRLRQKCIYLEETYTFINGLKIYGSPYTPGMWAFGYSRGKNRWYSIPNDTDILVTHGPIEGNKLMSFNGFRHSRYDSRKKCRM